VNEWQNQCIFRHFAQYQIMLISSQKGFIFIHIYKTGGTSIRRVLERYDDRFNFFHRMKSYLTPNPVLSSKTIHKHMRVEKIVAKLGREKFRQYYSFAFVRNPWDWQLSLYFQILHDANSPNHKLVKKMGTYENYVDWRVHEACRLQSDFLYIDDELMVNVVGKYESLEADFQQIVNTINLKETALPHLNNRKKGNYKSYYNETTRQMIAEAYQKDIERFGYEF